MAKTLKTWTAVGIALVGTTQILEAAPSARLILPHNPAFILSDGEGGEGASEGGEGGGQAVSSYKLDSTDPTAFAFDAKPQIEAYATLVHQSYADAATGADKMAAAIDALLDKPSPESLAAARAAWVAARPAYLETEAYRFYDGPIEAIEGDINSWPMNEAYIDYVEGNPKAGIINNGTETITGAGLAAINQKSDEADVTTGWHAIEFLLWGQDLSTTGPGNRPSTDYIAGEGNNDRRRAYLKAVTEKLVGDLQSLEQQWAPSVAGNYREAFEKLDQREALGRMVNGMAILAGFEFMSERLGVALDSGDQEDEHSCFSDTTKQDFVHDLAGIKRVWQEAKLAGLVKSRDAAVASEVDGLLADAEAKIGALGDPWDAVLRADAASPERKAAEEAMASLQALADGLKKVGSTLGVLVLIPTE